MYTNEKCDARIISKAFFADQNLAPPNPKLVRCLLLPLPIFRPLLARMVRHGLTSFVPYVSRWNRRAQALNRPLVAEFHGIRLTLGSRSSLPPLADLIEFIAKRRCGAAVQ
jgi:hypothetical protein